MVQNNDGCAEELGSTRCYSVGERLSRVGFLSASFVLAACIGRIEPDGSAEPRPRSSPSRSSAGGASLGGSNDGKVDAKGGSGTAGPSSSGGNSGSGNNVGDAGSGNTQGGTQGQAGGVGTGDPPPIISACDISITNIAVSQAVEIPVVKAGSAVTTSARVAPLIQNKKALFRVYAEPSGSAHEVIARLTLRTGEDEKILTDSKTLSQSSSQSNLNSTFNFVVDAELIGADTTYSVELTEAESCSGDKGNTRFPESSQQELEAIETGTVRVQLVPVRTSGGSAPVFTQEIADLFESEGNAQYPSANFEVTLGAEELDTGVGMSLNGAGWEEVLDELGSYRSQEAPPDNVHFYGLVRPTSSFSSGVAGLAGGSGRRGSIGIGISYPNLLKAAAGTFVHELGHMHSLPHSPGCRAAGADGNYPNDDGTLDVWGWDSRKNSLIDPDETYDFLTYCDPTWVSAYVYKQLAEHVATIESQRFIAYGEATPYHSAIVDSQGNARWGSSFVSRLLPDGDPETVEARDATGKVVASVTAYRVELHDAHSAFVRIPNVSSSWASIHIAGAKPLSTPKLRY